MAKSLTSTINSAIKGTIDLEKFKKGKNLSAGVVFKEQRWIPLSQAFQDTLQIPGIPVGHITLLRASTYFVVIKNTSKPHLLFNNLLFNKYSS